MLNNFNEAIERLQQQRNAIDKALEVLRAFDQDGTTGPTKRPLTKTANKRVLSAEARLRIAAAQKKRWAAVREAKKAANLKVAQEAGRKAIAALKRTGESEDGEVNYTALGKYFRHSA